MGPKPTWQRAWARRWLIAGAVAAGLALAIVVVWVVAAPGVVATCGKLLELAEIAGETTDDADRATCEDRYTTLRARVGAVAWAELSWCVRRAPTIPDAGGCG